MSTAHELTRRWLDTARAGSARPPAIHQRPALYLPEIAAYHRQQAAEKLIKAVLIYRGIEPARIHDIDAFVGRLSPSDPIRPALEPLGRFTSMRSLSAIRARISTRALPSATTSPAGLPRSKPLIKLCCWLQPIRTTRLPHRPALRGACARRGREETELRLPLQCPASSMVRIAHKFDLVAGAEHVRIEKSQPAMFVLCGEKRDARSLF